MSTRLIWLHDLRYRRRHRRFADNRSRLISLTDDWPLYFNGYAAWCDGRRRKCTDCGGRCCACHHHAKEGV